MTELEKIKQTVEHIKKRTSLKPQVGVTLGSGLSSFVDHKMTVDIAIPYEELPHFIPPSVAGHKGQLVFGAVNNVPIAALQGRIHFYEGHTMNQVVFPTRVLAQLGIKGLLLTNASGGIDDKMSPGDFMIITDHINLTGTSPLIGPNIEELGPRFPDMSEVYNRDWVQKLEDILKDQNLRFKKGIYCGVHGPSYETAAEVQYLRTIGGSAVGMSTVPEAIAAKHMGLKLAGLSCITNLATGISEQAITHEEVKAVAKQVESDFCEVVERFVG